MTILAWSCTSAAAAAMCAVWSASADSGSASASLPGVGSDGSAGSAGEAVAAGRPAHRYALADFGLTAEQVDERFAGYRWQSPRG